MPSFVSNGALLACSFGAAPSSLTVLPTNKVKGKNAAVATVMDHIPNTNIAPFGMCSAPTNPTVIAATAAALGVLTPMPCVPATAAPWLPGSTAAKIKHMPVLTQPSKCLCTWLGVIQITNPGPAKVTGK